ncbi:ABC transporter substrate-binding protein [Geotoga petraea]|jgi:glucose/mannose transport system substrate-binding protein|uniref:Probable sugar-binding periplasmic protein n=1 Tax=Geotoga petraea TaxID=28234 RepID=A0A4Z0W4E4_9BACT|nr:ABC transporter substrate-binding protein [Geotoga petraea]MDK2946251.1 glucose/mannose transport system substrate-binding protein [Geotoga sp.]TGG88696.1 carbohydrate ABC transporter substrate-binding protein [Geotoga petraea]
MKKLLVSFLAILFVFSSAFAAGELEIFSWWTGGGEEEGLLALFELFKEDNPDVEIINAAVAGGAGTNAKAVLKTRMLGGNPPDSFQVHAGMELTTTYVVTGMMEPLTDYFDEWGVKDKFPQGLLDIVSYKGDIYSVPVNVHRGNIVFYNKEIFDELGLKEPTNWAEFITALNTVQEAGYVPLAMGDKNKWPAGQLFEAIMVSEYGAEEYNKLFRGEAPFDQVALDRALDKIYELTNYFNKDHAALTWQDATRLLYDNEAVFNLMGDWAEGYMKTLGWTPGEDFGWFELPGTQNSFMLISDTFGLPKGAPNRENAIKWLEFLSTREAQDTFNPIKGSIPARTDADMSKYDAYLTSTIEDFSTKIITPSIAHGSAADESFITSMNDAINILLTTGNTSNAKRSILWAAEDAGLMAY